ncbi:hypothetical protein JCM10213_001392 [Rhodosporidiobolus nylandii]
MIASAASLTSSSAAKPKHTFLRKLFSSSPRATPAPSPQDPESILREILSLNARHGAPEVQAFSVRTSPPKSSSSSSSSSSNRAPCPLPPKYSKRPPPTAQETFDEIMKLNAKHGAPDVQALYVR